MSRTKEGVNVLLLVLVYRTYNMRSNLQLYRGSLNASAVIKSTIDYNKAAAGTATCSQQLKTSVTVASLTLWKRLSFPTKRTTNR